MTFALLFILMIQGAPSEAYVIDHGLTLEDCARALEAAKPNKAPAAIVSGVRISSRLECRPERARIPING